MKLVVTGGGTGGHIYPALAVAEAFQAAGDQTLYIGKTGGLESELVPGAGIAFAGVSFYGMPRNKTPLLPFQLLKWWWALHRAKAAAKSLLKAFSPDAVFGTGGYVSAPVLMAARELGIPYAVHEPDAEPGLVNRWMGKHARLITASFEAGAKALARPGIKTAVTGNPIRGTLGQVSRAQAFAALGVDWPADQTVLLVTGGSQGARTINQAVTAALPRLLDELNLAVIHVTGKTQFEPTQQTVPPELQAHSRYILLPYEPDMPRLMGAASLALCRAGSLSLSEMYLSGLPTLLVPYPHAAADHQRKNARASVDAGASLYIEDAECSGERIFNELKTLLEDRARMAAMTEAARRLAHPHATGAIVAALREIARPASAGK